jgi:putative flippase GtrA
LSGLGWLLDFVIFGLGVILFEMTAFYSNLFSASFAALFVFLASQILIFKVKKFDTLSLIIYLTYTEINIILWALLIGYIANISSQLIELDIASIMAKIFVTPFSLACNYLVAKSISKKSSNE